jgi:DNA excision repair protein ERCC-2
MGSNSPKTLCIGLTSRRNLCIHEVASSEKDAISVDSKCRNMTASFVREQQKYDPSIPLCSFFENFELKGKDTLLHGVYSIDDLRQFGTKMGWCPYFIARHSVNLAQIIVYNYQYIIDPKISELVSKEFKSNSIVVFDEAHNIDNVCIDSLSINITKQTLEASSRNIIKLQDIIKQ